LLLGAPGELPNISANNFRGQFPSGTGLLVLESNSRVTASVLQAGHISDSQFCFLPVHPQEEGSRMPATAMGSDVKFADARLATGLRLRYAEQGPRDGRAVLLLHGWTDSWFSFSRVLPLLPREWRVMAPDQRGHGESEKPAGGYAMRELARDAIALLDVLGIERAAVVGHSMGSFVAQHVAALEPERADRVVLVDSAVTCRHAEVLPLFEAVRSFEDTADEGFIREFQSSTINQPVPAEFFERVVRESKKLPLHAWKALARAHFEFDSRAIAGSVRAPLFALWGEKDAVFPRAQQEEFRRHYPSAAFKTYPGAGHAPHWEIPAEFARDVVAFLA
jgi:pimeloyl-ACP methyl ester carboxylesterase